MSCAKIPSELEEVEAHEFELTMAHVKYNKALREAAREKGLRNKHMRCSVCVRTIENMMRNKALTPVHLCFQCHAISPGNHHGCCRKQNMRRNQKNDVPNV